MGLFHVANLDQDRDDLKPRRWTLVYRVRAPTYYYYYYDIIFIFIFIIIIIIIRQQNYNNSGIIIVSINCNLASPHNEPMSTAPTFYYQ